MEDIRHTAVNDALWVALEAVLALRLALALADEDGRIGLQHLPDEVLRFAPQPVGEALEAEAEDGPGGTLQASGQRAIRAAIAACNGNLSAAARRLGIGRATLYRKMKEMELGA